MKITPIKNQLFLFLFCIFFCHQVDGQTVTGSWYGIGQVTKAGVHNSYLSEMIIKQNGNKVSGEFIYFFRDLEIKTKITGSYRPKSRTLLLNAAPVLNYQAKSINGADCPMEGLFSLKVSRVETTLSGSFNPDDNYRLTCPEISVRFIKATPSIQTPDLPIADAEEEGAPPPPPVVVKKPVDTFLVKLNERAFDVSPVIEVDVDSLKVTLYDNGEVDNDTVSVFSNRKVIVQKQMLSASPLTFMVPIDTGITEIAMYAENLGKIAPNTALAIIYAGEQRFEVSMSSNFIKNSTIRFRRKTKTQDTKNIN
jgi:hypothetical protein